MLNIHKVMCYYIYKQALIKGDEWINQQVARSFLSVPIIQAPTSKRACTGRHLYLPPSQPMPWNP